MNVGQILETHLGWAAAGLGKLVTESLEEWRATNDVKQLKETLSKVYGNDEPLPESEEDLVELAGNLHKGVPFATPVFDGAREARHC